MSDMIAIKSNKLPAHLQGKAKANNLFAAAMQVGGFPTVSIRGKEFNVRRGDEETLITNADGDAAGSIDAIVVSANPNKSKVYYAETFKEGSVAKPTCYSNDGTAPSVNAEEPQAKKCATCPHNQWGSKITDNGGKGKACGDSMRLCIAAADQINDPMLLRVPAATLKALGQYGAQLARRGVEPHHVVTKIGFERGVAYPSLTFKAVRFVEEDELQEIEDLLNAEADTIGRITGLIDDVQSNGDTPAEKQEEEPKPKPKAKPKPAPAPEPEPETEAEEVTDDIDAELDDLDWDD